MTNKICAALAVAVLSASGVQAAVITPVTRAQFQVAVSNGTVSCQNFDSLANGIITNPLDGVTYGASAGLAIVTDMFATTTNPNGLGSTSFGYFSSTEPARFFFASPISAFAIDVNSFAVTPGAYIAELVTRDIANSLPLAFSNQRTGAFIGFITDTPFSNVAISATTGFSYTLDTLVFGSAAAVLDAVPIPEPASLALLGVSVLGLVLRRSQRS